MSNLAKRNNQEISRFSTGLEEHGQKLFQYSFRIKKSSWSMSSLLLPGNSPAHFNTSKATVWLPPTRIAMLLSTEGVKVALTATTADGLFGASSLAAGGRSVLAI